MTNIDFSETIARISKGTASFQPFTGLNVNRKEIFNENFSEDQFEKAVAKQLPTNYYQLDVGAMTFGNRASERDPVGESSLREVEDLIDPKIKQYEEKEQVMKNER